MSKFHFTGSNHGGAITGIYIQDKGKNHHVKVLAWLLNHWIKQNRIASITITTESKRARKELLDKADFAV